MKLYLKNFKCYVEKEFDFGSEGVILISGSSGIGKTTILNAIHFVLTGIGTKIIHCGKSSCKVKLEYKNFTITRSKRPNRLLVVKREKSSLDSSTKEYEDESAQSIINEIFGKNFSTTGYISQNNRNSFMLMSPLEKLAFIENFAFKDINLIKIKKKCKEIIREKNDIFIKTQSKLELAQEMIKQTDKPEKIEFPIKCSNKNKKSVVLMEKKKCGENIILLKKELKNSKELKIKINNYKIFKERIKNLQEQLISVKKEKESLIIVPKPFPEKLEQYNNQLEELLNNKDILELRKKCKLDKTQLEELQDNEDSNLSQKIQEIEKKIFSREKIKNLKEDLEIVEEQLQDSKNVKKLIKKLEKNPYTGKDLIKYSLEVEKIEKELDKNKKILEQKIYKCPICSSRIEFDYSRDKFIPYSCNYLNKDKEIILQEIESLTQEFQENKSQIDIINYSIRIRNDINKEFQNICDEYDIKSIDELPSLEETKNNLDEIKNLLDSQKQFSTRLKQIRREKNTRSQTLILLQNKLNRNLEILKEKEKLVPQDIEWDKLSQEKDIRFLINKEKNFVQEYKNYCNSKIYLDKKIDEINCKIQKEHDNSEFSSTNFFEGKLKEAINNSNKKIEQFQKSIKTCKINLQQIKMYIDYTKELKKYREWKIKVEQLKKEEIKNRKIYGASCQFKELILEAESIACGNIINSINSSAKIYLELFFPDDPISIEILPFKKNKKGGSRPQLNVQIEYKGMEADLSMLSGGEVSRVVLAYTLALGELFNSPIMMLDECTSSLDQELNSLVMETIRENYNGNLVIIIAHQVVKGSYDKVIEL